MRHEFSKTHACNNTMERNQFFKSQARHLGQQRVSLSEEKDKAPISHTDKGSTAIHLPDGRKNVGACHCKGSKQAKEHIQDTKQGDANDMFDREHFSAVGDTNHIIKTVPIFHQGQFCYYIVFFTSNSALSNSINTNSIQLIANTVKSKETPPKEGISQTTSEEIGSGSDGKRFIIMSHCVCLKVKCKRVKGESERRKPTGIDKWWHSLFI